MTPSASTDFSTEPSKTCSGEDPQRAHADFAVDPRLLAKGRHNSGVHALFDQCREEAAFGVPPVADLRQMLQVKR